MLIPSSTWKGNSTGNTLFHNAIIEIWLESSLIYTHLNIQFTTPNKVLWTYHDCYHCVRKCQDYVYIKWEYWSTMWKIKRIIFHTSCSSIWLKSSTIQRHIVAILSWMWTEHIQCGAVITRYNVLEKPHKRLQWCMQYHVILDHIITAPDIISLLAAHSWNIS